MLVVQDIARGVSVSNEVTDLGIRVVFTGVLRVLVALGFLVVPSGTILSTIGRILMDTLVVLPLAETSLELLALALLFLCRTDVSWCRSWVRGHSISWIRGPRRICWTRSIGWLKSGLICWARGGGGVSSRIGSWDCSPATVVPVPVVVAERSLTEGHESGLHVVGGAVQVTESRGSTAGTPVGLATLGTGTKASA